MGYKVLVAVKLQYNTRDFAALHNIRGRHSIPNNYLLRGRSQEIWCTKEEGPHRCIEIF